MRFIRKISTVSAFVASLAWSANLMFAVIIMYQRGEPKAFVLDSPKKLLILAAHQDDGVIMAGGLAAQNVKLGGEVEIVYLTRIADAENARIRKSEAYEAWSVLGTEKVILTFLDFISKKIWSENKRRSARNAIISSIERSDPDLVIIPLKEGGHSEHDLLNTLVFEALDEFSNIEVLQAAEYNPYYIMENTPQKILWFMARLLPLVPYKEPNYGLVPRNQTRLQMSREEVEVKIKMLSTFASQKGVIPERQFGYADLFETTSDLPRGVYKLKGKLFSPWAILTLFMTFLMIWSWGFASALCLGKYMRYIGVTIFVFFCLCVILNGARAVFDDLLYLIVFLVALVFARALELLCSSRS